MGKVEATNQMTVYVHRSRSQKRDDDIWECLGLRGEKRPPLICLSYGVQRQNIADFSGSTTAVPKLEATSRLGPLYRVRRESFEVPCETLGEVTSQNSHL